MINWRSKMSLELTVKSLDLLKRLVFMEFQIEIIFDMKFHIYKVLWSKGLGLETFWVQAKNGEMVIESNRPLVDRLGKPKEEIYWRVVRGELRAGDVQSRIITELQAYVQLNEYQHSKKRKGR